MSLYEPLGAGRGTTAADLDMGGTTSEDDRKKQLKLLAKEKKKEFDHMTSSVLMEQQKNLLASLHFRFKYESLLFFPSIGITLVTGILAVLAKSTLYSDQTNERFTMCIAILAPLSVFMQSLTKQLDYGGRASLHDSAAMSLAKIFKVAVLRSRAQEILMLDNDLLRPKAGDVEVGIPVMAGKTNQDGSDGNAEEEGKAEPTKPSGFQHKDEDDHFTLTKQFDQALQGCTSPVPIRITAAFNILESRINVCNKRLIPSSSGDTKPKIAWEKVYPGLYHQMTLTIIGSKLWPLRVPDAEWAVNKTFDDFQKHLNDNTNDHPDLLEVLVTRANEIEEDYSKLTTMSTEALLPLNRAPSSR